MTEPGRALYQRYLAKSLPRAVAIAPNGNAAIGAGGFDPLAKALELCGKTASGCRLYAVDNDVVWTKPAPPPRPTRFAALANETAVPYMTDKGRDGYRKFLGFPEPRAFVIAPDGAWFASARGADPIAQAMAGCIKLHQGCRLYAYNDDVVWTRR